MYLKGLEQFIRYNRFVTRIYLQNGKGSPWIVESVKSLKSTEDKINPQEVDKEKYDYVVLANGHYAEVCLGPFVCHLSKDLLIKFNKVSPKSHPSKVFLSLMAFRSMPDGTETQSNLPEW